MPLVRDRGRYGEGANIRCARSRNRGKIGATRAFPLCRFGVVDSLHHVPLLPALSALNRPDTLKGKRDRALLALGFAGAFRRSRASFRRNRPLAPLAENAPVGPPGRASGNRAARASAPPRRDRDDGARIEQASGQYGSVRAGAGASAFRAPWRSAACRW